MFVGINSMSADELYLAIFNETGQKVDGLSIRYADMPTPKNSVMHLPKAVKAYKDFIVVTMATFTDTGVKSELVVFVCKRTKALIRVIPLQLGSRTVMVSRVVDNCYALFLTSTSFILFLTDSPEAFPNEDTVFPIDTGNISILFNINKTLDTNIGVKEYYDIKSTVSQSVVHTKAVLLPVYTT